MKPSSPLSCAPRGRVNAINFAATMTPPKLPLLRGEGKDRYLCVANID